MPSAVFDLTSFFERCLSRISAENGPGNWMDPVGGDSKEFVIQSVRDCIIAYLAALTIEEQHISPRAMNELMNPGQIIWIDVCSALTDSHSSEALESIKFQISGAISDLQGHLAHWFAKNYGIDLLNTNQYGPGVYNVRYDWVPTPVDSTVQMLRITWE